jgi:hypothetical protein
MAFSSKSKVIAVKKETTEGELVDPVAADFIYVRADSALTSGVESTQSDEVRNTLGASKAFVTKEAPTGSINLYLKTSGVEGTAPESAPLFEACLGGVETHATEVNTAAGSTAGTSAARAVIKVADGDIATGEFKVGQAVLIKDGTNGYAVRPIWSLDESASPDEVTLGFNLANAPASGIGLGKATFFQTLNSGHPTLSAHEYQASSSSAYHVAHGGVRTTSMTLDYPANDLATASFEIAGINFSENPIRIEATNKYIDFTDSTGTVAAIINEDVYQTPYHLADEIGSKMTAASVGSADDVITCTFSKSTGKFTIASDGSVLSLLWLTGTNNANSIDTTIGFTHADDTGALTYEADNALTYDPPVTPSYDDADPRVVKDNMLILGNYDDYICFGGQAFNIAVSTPKTDVNNWCAESGVDESVILSREVTVTGTLKFSKHDASRTYKMLKNETISLAFVTGSKTAGNWDAGTVTCVFCPEVSITTKNIVDNDGYIVEDFAGTAIVGTDGLEDVYITQL